MNTSRKTAIIVGVLFIIGTVAGVLSFGISGPILSAPDYLIKIAANENQMLIGSLFVLIMGFPLAMVPVMMYPIFKKHNEVLALGSVIFRGVLEAVSYIVIVIIWLLLISLSQAYVKAGAPDASSFHTLGALLLEACHWLDHILAIVFSIGALMIYYLFYQLKLIPRWLSVWGFAGAILYLAAPLLNMFNPQHPTLSVTTGVGRLMAPLAVQEMVFALWLIVKGFNSSAIASQSQ
jgi:hypothetical protein